MDSDLKNRALRCQSQIVHVLFYPFTILHPFSSLSEMTTLHAQIYSPEKYE